MKPLNLVIIVVALAVAFTAGYMTSSFRHRQEEDARKERVKKQAEEFRKAEKAFDDLLTLPKNYGR